MNLRSTLRTTVSTALALAAFAVTSPAASLTWDANPAYPGAQDGSGTWDTNSASWWTGAINTNFSSAIPDAPVFGVANGPAGTVTLGGPITSGNITFNAPSAGTGVYTIAGGTNTLTLSGGTVTAAVNAVINANLAGGSITLANAAGMLILGGTNTFTGLTLGPNAATTTTALRVTSSGALGTGTVAFNSQGNATSPRLEIAGGITVSNALSINGRSSLSAAVLGINGANTLSGTVSGTTGGGEFHLESDVANGLTLSGAAAGGVALQSATGARLFTLQGPGTGTISGIITNGSTASGTSIGIIKAGSGAWTLSGANTYTNATTVDGGILTLDYSTQNNSKLSDFGPLILGGGTLNLTGGSHTEVVTGTTLNPGGSAVTRAGGSSTLRLNTITRVRGGVLDFGAASIADTDTSDVNGILGGYATVAGSDWAHSGAAASDTAITAYAAYTDKDALGSTIADGSTSNVRLSTTAGSGNIVLGSTTTTINTLLQNTTSAATIDTSGKILRLGATGGVLIPSGKQSLTFGTAITSGALTAGGADNTPGELILINNSANPLTVNSFITNNGTGLVSLIKAGAGTVALNGANGHGGTNFIVGGILQVGSDGNLGAVPAAATAGKIMLNGGTLQPTASFVLNSTRGLSVGPASGYGNGTIDVPGGVTLTYNGVIANAGGAGSLTKSGAGALVLSNANSYTWGTIISGGTLIISNDTALGAVPNVYHPDNLVLNGAVLEAGTNISLSAARGMLLGPVAGTGNGTIDVVPGATLTVAGRIMDNWGGSGSTLTKVDAGNLVLSANNTYSGGTLVSGGTLQLTGNGTAGFGPITNNSTLVLNFAGVVGVGNTISGTGSVLNAGTNTTTLGGVNTFTGGVVSTNGTIVLANAGALGTGSLLLTNNAVQVVLAGAMTVTNPILVGAPAGLAGTGAIKGPATGYATITSPIFVSVSAAGGGATGAGGLFDGGNATNGLMVSGPLTNTTGAAIHVRANRVTFAYPGGGSYSSLQDSGIVVLGANNGLATNAVLEVGTSAAGLFDLAGFSQTLNGLKNGASAAVVTNSGGAASQITVTGTSSNTAFAGAIGDDGAHKILLTVSGGTFTLGGSNSYSGDTTVGAGSTLKTASATALPSGTGKGNLALSGTLDLNGTNASVNGLAGGGAVLNSSANASVLTVGNNNAGGTFSGPIQSGGGPLSIVKAGAGALNLAGALTYTGSTTVSGGSLVLGGGSALPSSSAATITVGGGATLDVTAAGGLTLGGSQTLAGAGTVAGSVSDSAGSLILPGGSNAVGLLAINNNLTLAGGDTLSFDFAASTNDSITVGGNLTPNGTTTINLASLPAGAYLPSGNYTLLRVSGALNGSAANFVLSGVPSPTRQTFTIAYDTSSSPKRVLLQVGGSTSVLVWQGSLGGGVWDTTTLNWLNGSTSDHFYSGDVANFTDAGVANPPVLNIAVVPSQVNFSASGNYSLTGGGKISGGGSLTQSGSGAVTNSTANDYTGVTTLSAGLMSVSAVANGGAASPLGAASSDPANLVLNGGRLQYTGGATSTDRGATLGANGGTLEVTSGGNALTMAGTIAGSSGGGLTKAGVDPLILAGTNAYNGPTTISAGILQVGAGSTSGTLGTGPVINHASLVIERADTLALSNVISGSGSLTKNGNGTLVLSATNTYTGGLLINTGIVQVAYAQALGGTPSSFNSNQITLNGGELEATASFTISDTNTGINCITGTIGVDTNVTLVISNSVVASNSFTKALPGTLVLSGSNSLAGTLYVDTASTTSSDGALRVTSTNALGGVATVSIRNNQAAASSTLQLDGTAGALDLSQSLAWSGRNNLVPAIQSLAGNNSWNLSSVTLVAGGTFYPFECDAGSLTLSGGFPGASPAAARSIVFMGNGTFDVTGPINSAGSVIGVLKTNNGVVNFSDNNSYTGPTSIQGGTVNILGGQLGVSTTNIEMAPLSGEVATLNISNGTVYAQRVVIAGATGNNTAPGSATLNQYAGNVYSSQWFTVGSGGTTGGSGTYNLSGGSLTLQNNTASGSQMEVANFNASTGVVNLSGSGQILLYSNAYLTLGANANAGNGSVNQSGGSVTFYGDSGSTVGGNGYLYLGRATGLTNSYSYRLNGGTLTVPQIASISGNSQFYFNGGILQAAKTNAGFMSGLTIAAVSTRGAIIDDNGNSVTIAQPLVHDPALGGTVDGGLTKQGSGILALTGTNTYTGATAVNNGTLLIHGVNGASAVAVSGGTLGGNGIINGPVTLQSGVLSPGASVGVLTISNNLSLQGGTLLFELTGATNDLLNVSGVFSASSATTVQLNFPIPAVGTYTLVRYGTFSGSLANLNLSIVNARYSFTLINDTAAKAIKVVVSGISANLVWQGDGGLNGWDNQGNYANWLNGSTTDKFYDGDIVTFNDSGSASAPINLVGTLSAGSVTVNSSKSYDFAGSGLLDGPGGLIKSGSGQLILEDNNTYGGSTLINGGSLQVGNGSTTGTLGTGPVTNNATLVYNRSDSLLVTNPIYGSGSLSDIGPSGSLTLSGSVTGYAVTMAGSGAMFLTASNGYSGLTVVSAGSLHPQNSYALGTADAGTIATNGGLLYFDANVDFPAEPLVLGGQSGGIALRKGGSGVTTLGGAVSLVSDTTLFVDGGATLNLTNGAGLSGPGLNLTLDGDTNGLGNVQGPITLNAGSITKNGNGIWALGLTNNYTGGTVVNAGFLRIPSATALGQPPAAFNAAQITVNGGQLEFNGPAVFNDGRRGFTIGTANVAVVSNATVNISNLVTLTGAMTKAGNGTLILSGSNALTGTLYVDTAINSGSDGAVCITTSNAIAGVSSPIYIRNNNGGYSAFQLDGSAGPIQVTTDFRVSCRNTINPIIENLAGSNTISGGFSIDVGGALLPIQSDTNLLTLAGNLDYVGTLTGSRTYTFQGDGSFLVSGSIDNSGNGAPISVAKSGAGTLTLTAANSYGNATTNYAGVTLISGSITSTGGVWVVGGTLSGGNSFSGAGVINDSVTVQSAGSLSPGQGTNSIDVLTISQSLTNAGTIVMNLKKTGSVLTNDAIVGLTNLVYGGTLQLVPSGSSLAIGDSFKLFDSTAYSGAFTSLAPAVPGPGLAWNTSTLTMDGTIRVVTAPSVTAAFTLGPTNGTAPLTVSFTNTTSGAYVYALWTFGDGNTLLSTNPVVSHTYTVGPATNDVSLQVTNASGLSSTYTVSKAVRVGASSVAGKPGIAGFRFANGTLTLLGTNQAGSAGHIYYLRASTNAAAPLATWLRVATNYFSANGGFTNSLATTGAQQFYLIEAPLP